jgi:hypothetical protein
VKGTAPVPTSEPTIRTRVEAALPAWLCCLWRGQHQPKRYFLGGYVCRDCGARGANLDAMGYRDQSYVEVERKPFERDPRYVRASAA